MFFAIETSFPICEPLWNTYYRASQRLKESDYRLICKYNTPKPSNFQIQNTSKYYDESSLRLEVIDDWGNTPASLTTETQLFAKSPPPFSGKRCINLPKI